VVGSVVGGTVVSSTLNIFFNMNMIINNTGTTTKISNQIVKTKHNVTIR